MGDKNYSRREFIAEAGKTAVAAAIVAPITGFGVSNANKTPPTIGVITLDLAQPEYRPLKAAGGAVKIPNPLDKKKPIIVARLSDAAVAAYSSRCPHWGCEVTLPVKNIITCPCHKSTFDLAGQVTHGPAKRDLPQFAASLAGAIVTITDKPAPKQG